MPLLSGDQPTTRISYHIAYLDKLISGYKYKK